MLSWFTANLSTSWRQLTPISESSNKLTSTGCTSPTCGIRWLTAEPDATVDSTSPSSRFPVWTIILNRKFDSIKFSKFIKLISTFPALVWPTRSSCVPPADRPSQSNPVQRTPSPPPVNQAKIIHPNLHIDCLTACYWPSNTSLSKCLRQTNEFQKCPHPTGGFAAEMLTCEPVQPVEYLSSRPSLWHCSWLESTKSTCWS